MRRLVRKCFSTRKATAISSVVIALVFASAAFATAFVLFVGIGSTGGGGTFVATTTNMGAITLAVQPITPALGPTDTSAVLAITATNNDSNAPHGVSVLNEAFTSSPAACASHLHLNNKASIIGTINDGNASDTVLNPSEVRNLATQTQTGGFGPLTATVTLDSGAPGTCASGTYTLSFTGTTT